MSIETGVAYFDARARATGRRSRRHGRRRHDLCVIASHSTCVEKDSIRRLVRNMNADGSLARPWAGEVFAANRSAIRGDHPELAGRLPPAGRHRACLNQPHS